MKKTEIKKINARFSGTFAKKNKQKAPVLASLGNRFSKIFGIAMRL